MTECLPNHFWGITHPGEGQLAGEQNPNTQTKSEHLHNISDHTGNTLIAEILWGTIIYNKHSNQATAYDFKQSKQSSLNHSPK